MAQAGGSNESISAQRRHYNPKFWHHAISSLLCTRFNTTCVARHHHVIERLAWQFQLFAGRHVAAPKFGAGPNEQMIAPDSLGFTGFKSGAGERLPQCFRRAGHRRVRLLQRNGRISAGREEHKNRCPFRGRVDAELQIGFELRGRSAGAWRSNRRLRPLSAIYRTCCPRNHPHRYKPALGIDRTINKAGGVFRIGTLQILHQRGRVCRTRRLLINNHAVAVPRPSLTSTTFRPGLRGVFQKNTFATGMPGTGTTVPFFCFISESGMR